MFAVLRELITFSLPIMLGQIGITLIGAGDVYMATQHGTLTVASIGVANGVVNPIFLFGIGMLMGVSPAMAIRRGRGKDVVGLLPTTLYYATLISIFMTFLMLGVNQLVPFMGFKSELVPYIQEYISIISWSFLPAYYYQAVKEFLQSFENVILANTISIVAVFVNLGLNYILVFGAFGIPSLGVKGLAIASLLIRILMCFSILFFARKYLSKWFIDNQFAKRIIRFSLPVAFMIFLEVFAFCMVAILVGGMNVVEAAANNIIMNLTSITFMIPSAISNAVAVKIGAAYGAMLVKKVFDYTKAALSLSIGSMFATAVLYWFIPHTLMRFFTEDIAVVGIGAQLLLIIAMFQLVDGIQVTLTGVMRGIEKTKESTIMIFVGYWLLGLPFGAWLAFNLQMNAKGLWLGLAIALGVVAIGLVALSRKAFITFAAEAKNG
jgi:MATE family multidrug resistance protein